VPDVRGGLVITDWPRKTEWYYEYNKKLAQIAEGTGFDNSPGEPKLASPLDIFHGGNSKRAGEMAGKYRQGNG